MPTVTCLWLRVIETRVITIAIVWFDLMMLQGLLVGKQVIVRHQHASTNQCNTIFRTRLLLSLKDISTIVQ